MKTLIAIALSAACLLAADTNIVLTPLNKEDPTNSIPFVVTSGPQKIEWTIESNKIATITIRTNFVTNWIALEMTSPNIPKKYIGVEQTNRVMWIIYAGRTNELHLDTLWTEEIRMKQAPVDPRKIPLKK